MSTTTTNLALFEYDPVADANQTYNITNALNDNWDKIDAATGKLSDLTTVEQGSLVGAINEVNSSIPDTSGFATKDLDNLSATGKDKVVSLAHELDFANASSISTTSSSYAQAYTCTDDGVIILQVSSYTTSSTTKGSHVKLWCNSDVVGEFWTGFGGGVANSADYKSLMYHYKKGDYASFIIYSSGYGSNTVSARFVPYKKA